MEACVTHVAKSTSCGWSSGQTSLQLGRVGCFGCLAPNSPSKSERFNLRWNFCFQLFSTIFLKRIGSRYLRTNKELYTLEICNMHFLNAVLLDFTTSEKSKTWTSEVPTCSYNCWTECSMREFNICSGLGTWQRFWPSFFQDAACCDLRLHSVGLLLASFAVWSEWSQSSPQVMGQTQGIEEGMIV